MRIFKVGRKLLPDAVILNLLGKEKKLSFRIVEKEVSGDKVSVLVRGEVPCGLFRNQIDEEWVEIDIRTLTEQFCIEKYGVVPDPDSLEFRREYIRAKLVATRYAVGLAKKRIENRFLGKEFREAFEKELERVELLNIYTRAEKVRELAKRREETEKYLKHIRERYPQVYEEIKKRFVIPERVTFRTEEQSVKIHALVRELGLSEQEYRNLLKNKFGVSSSLALTRKEASELIRELEELRKVKEMCDKL